MVRAREREVRSVRMTVSVSPAMHQAIIEAADEMGVSTSAWCALRLGEAVRTQRGVGRAFEALGVSVAEAMAREAEADE